MRAELRNAKDAVIDLRVRAAVTLIIGKAEPDRRSARRAGCLRAHHRLVDQSRRFFLEHGLWTFSTPAKGCDLACERISQPDGTKARLWRPTRGVEVLCHFLPTTFLS